MPPATMSRYTSNIRLGGPQRVENSSKKIAQPSIKIHPQVQGMLNKFSQKELVAEPYLRSVGEY